MLREMVGVAGTVGPLSFCEGVSCCKMFDGGAVKGSEDRR